MEIQEECSNTPAPSTVSTTTQRRVMTKLLRSCVAADDGSFQQDPEDVGLGISEFGFRISDLADVEGNWFPNPNSEIRIPKSRSQGSCPFSTSLCASESSCRVIFF